MPSQFAVKFLVKSYNELREFADAFDELAQERYLIYSSAASIYTALSVLHGDLFVLPSDENARLLAQLRKRGKQLARDRSLFSCSLGIIESHLEAVRLFPDPQATRIFEETAETACWQP